MLLGVGSSRVIEVEGQDVIADFYEVGALRGHRATQRCRAGGSVLVIDVGRMPASDNAGDGKPKLLVDHMLGRAVPRFRGYRRQRRCLHLHTRQAAKRATNGATGTRSRVPTRRTGTGNSPLLINSYAVLRPIPRMDAAVATSVWRPKARTRSSVQGAVGKAVLMGFLTLSVESKPYAHVGQTTSR